jgi:chemotaxis protein CheD
MGTLLSSADQAPDIPEPPRGDVSVAIGRWGVGAAPSRLRTLLGSCIGIALHDRVARLGGLAHIVLPDSRGDVGNLGKFADTAIPALIADLDRILQGRVRGRLTAKIAGGACMFQVSGGPETNSGPAPTSNIGELNRAAVERILNSLRIPILARDVGGQSGRRLTFDTSTGIVSIRVPGGGEYEI